MIISVPINNHSPHQLLHQAAFIKGCSKIGVKALRLAKDSLVKTDMVVCWGWRKGKVFREKGHNVIVMERGYIGDRFKYTSLGWNGLNNFASYPEYPDDGGSRFIQHGGVLKPWRKDGQYILVCGQVRRDMSLRGQDIMAWYKAISHKASKHYNLPVYFRPHPLEKQDGYLSIEGVPTLKCSLEEALSGALFTIAYNSNTCLDSLIQGIPCYAGDKGTMAWDLCMRNIEELYYPAREEVLYQIAHKQFSLEEISMGWPLKRVLECKL